MMNDLRDFESIVGGWYKRLNLPHLPREWQEWLADNVWWLTLITAIISIIGLSVIIPEFLAALSLTATLGSLSTAYGSTATHLGAFFWLSTLISTIGYMITTVLMIVSIRYLHAKHKKGWEYLFYAYAVNFGSSVIAALVILHIFDIIGGFVGALAIGYFLFEVHGHFVTRHTVTKKVKTAKTESK